VRRRPSVALLSLSLLLAGCGGAADAPERSAATQDRPAGADLTVVAAVYPFAWLAERVAPEAEVDLLQGAQEAHDLDLSPPQRAAIETADVVLYTGDIDYQPQVEQAVASAGGQVVSAVEVAGEDALLAAAPDAHSHGDEPHGDEPHGDEPHGTSRTGRAARGRGGGCRARRRCGGRAAR
jgi:ABC-type Zn uptake system ZnuABC Zn-binding protein ZnuA